MGCLSLCWVQSQGLETFNRVVMKFHDLVGFDRLDNAAVKLLGKQVLFGRLPDEGQNLPSCHLMDRDFLILLVDPNSIALGVLGLLASLCPFFQVDEFEDENFLQDLNSFLSHSCP